MAKITSINLLRSSKSHWRENFLKWALSTLRFLIILTETIALAAFVYRFSLDREIIDLADKIKQQQTLVEFLKNDEAKYRNIHERLAAAQTLGTQGNTKTELLKQLVTAAKGKVTFQKVTLDKSSFLLEISTNSTVGLSKFLESVKALPWVKRVNVDRVENRANTGVIIVSVTAEVQTEEKKEVVDGTQ
jgi:hypothetical protein